MSSQLFTTQLGTHISQLDFGPISGLPVLDGTGNMVGIISKKDTREAPPNALVEDFMTHQVVVTSPEQTVELAAITMLKYKVHRLPVVADRTLVGMLTRTDVFSALEHLFVHEEDATTGSGGVGG